MGRGGKYGIIGNEATFDQSAYGSLKVKVLWLLPEEVKGTSSWEFLFHLREVQKI